MKKKGRKARRKETESEDWCFVCKDGGDMIICDHKDCSKSYHPQCVDASAKSKSQFVCELHECASCGRTSDIHCYGCPKGICRRCIASAGFVHVRGKKGFCEHCLKLTLLVEENKDVDSDGERIDFNNRNTYETLYKEYWEIINSTEKLTLEILTSARDQLKSGMNYDSDNYEDSDEYECSDSEDKEAHDSGKKTKRSKPEPSKKKGKTKSNMKKEFSGWGSTSLMQFLTNIGKETTHALSQRELEKIIKGYSKEKKLLQKNKIVECDAWLQSVFGRKTVKLNRIFDLLETHLSENQVSSDEDDLGYDSEEEKLVVNSRKKKNTCDKTVDKAEASPHFHFASVVPENIRLVYLRRTLVQKLEKEPDAFENKMTGSFVRVKEDTNGCFSKGYQLMQVTGIKKCMVGENDQAVVLQSVDTDIHITSLSDDDFSEEECRDLRNKVKSGLLKKLVLVELEEKAKSLHKDIVTHWIPRELTVLKHRIDQANEKGWRKELFEYLERRQFLQDPANQSKLLEKIPTVVPDVEEVGPDKDSPKSILISEERKEEVPASQEYEMALKLHKFFGEKPKGSYFYDDGGEKASIVDISKEEVEDTESSEWYVMCLRGEKLGPVSLSVLKNWSQTPTAFQSKIYRTTQSEAQAKPLTAVIRLAFPRK